MSDEAGVQGASAPVSTELESAPAAEIASAPTEVDDAPKTSAEVADDAKPEPPAQSNGNASETEQSPATDSKNDEGATATPAKDVTMDDADKSNLDGDAPSSDVVADTTPAANGQDKTPRRKSTGGAQVKKLKGKQSKSNLKAVTHLDAQPGDHYFIRLKGYPLWPGIVVDDEMLPAVLSERRPVMARRADGTWREDLQDGGKNVNERVFPVMYLSTNEFGWIRNTDLVDLDFETVGQTSGKLRKDLQEAHELAAEHHDLEHYKGVLREFQENQLARAAEKEAKKQEKKEKAEAAAAEKKKTANKQKRKSIVSEAAVGDEDAEEDVEMADASGELDPEEPKPKSKKRKAVADAEDGSSTPQRTDSAKKPKIKINNTPKANGTDTPKASAKKEAKPKAQKSKKANGTANGDAPATPSEPVLTEEQKREKKEKEILFLRHKLQKGLLNKDQQPQEEEMKAMSDFITKLEGYAELEVSIIRVTKINKVLKAILKIEEIPKENDFQFKTRSTSLLEKWNKILESDIPVKDTEDKKEHSNGDSKSEQADAQPETEEDGKVSATAAEPADISMAHADAPAKESESKPESKDNEPVEPTLDVAPSEATA